MGTDEEGLLEVLCSRTGQQLKDIMVAYKLGKREETGSRGVQLYFSVKRAEHVSFAFICLL